MQEILEEAKRYEMRHLAYINIKGDINRTIDEHKEDKDKKNIGILYPFPKDKVDDASRNYDSQVTYYSSALIGVYKRLAEKIDWITVSVEAGIKKQYQNDKDMIKETNEDEDTVSYSLPYTEIPTVELLVTIDMEKYNKDELNKVIIELS